MSIVIASDSFARPSDTTPYVSGDLIANSTTAASVASLEFQMPYSSVAGMVRRARLAKSNDNVSNASFRLHLFSSDPCATAPSNGDNGVMQIAGAGAPATYMGYFDFGMTSGDVDIFVAGNAAISGSEEGSEILFDLSSTSASIFGLLEARAAYTPASGEVFTATLEVVMDI